MTVTNCPGRDRTLRQVGTRGMDSLAVVIAEAFEGRVAATGSGLLAYRLK